jgi:putative endonuclease
MLNRRASGQMWERAAEQFLRSRGLRTIDRNFHSRYGEIDLIMSDEQTLVFIEVRYRRKTDFGSGAESVTVTKQRRISRTAAYYLQQKKVHSSRLCRFDVVSISGDGTDSDMNWIKHAFDAY